MTYTVSLQHVAPRPLAVVRERMAVHEVPVRFRPLLDQVYAAAKSGAVALDGQNVFVIMRPRRISSMSSSELGLYVLLHLSAALLLP